MPLLIDDRFKTFRYDDGYKLVDIETAKMKSFGYDEDNTWNDFKYRDGYINKELPVSPLQNRVVINENTHEPPLTVYIELNSVVADLYNYKNLIGDQIRNGIFQNDKREEIQKVMTESYGYLFSSSGHTSSRLEDDEIYEKHIEEVSILRREGWPNVNNEWGVMLLDVELMNKWDDLLIDFLVIEKSKHRRAKVLQNKMKKTEDIFEIDENDYFFDSKKDDYRLREINRDLSYNQFYFDHDVNYSDKNALVYKLHNLKSAIYTFLIAGGKYRIKKCTICERYFYAKKSHAKFCTRNGRCSKRK